VKTATQQCLIIKYEKASVKTVFLFANSVVDTGGAPLVAKVFANFRKNAKMRYQHVQGTGGRLFIDKH
jgi:hypothetical protein